MQKHTLAFAMVGVAALGMFGAGLSGEPTSVTGSWQIDSRYSYAQIVTDGTTDFGKKTIDITLGFARLKGDLKVDDNDPGKSRLDFRIYPANSVAPSIGEDGKVLARWFENQANHTLVCFHSTSVVRTPDGRLKAAGNLTVTRIDRNVDVAPGEAYAGPVYGPPMINRVSQEATFILDISDQAANGEKVSGIYASTSTQVMREDFPQLTRAMVSTAWPPLGQEQHCEVPAPGEAYSGQKCTGTYLTPQFQASPARPGEDYSGLQYPNAITGERVVFQIQMHLLARGAEGQAASGN